MHQLSSHSNMWVMSPCHPRGLLLPAVWLPASQDAQIKITSLSKTWTQNYQIELSHLTCYFYFLKVITFQCLMSDQILLKQSFIKTDCSCTKTCTQGILSYHIFTHILYVSTRCLNTSRSKSKKCFILWDESQFSLEREYDFTNKTKCWKKSMFTVCCFKPVFNLVCFAPKIVLENTWRIIFPAVLETKY